jgi:hypothetical protein
MEPLAACDAGNIAIIIRIPHADELAVDTVELVH